MDGRSTDHLHSMPYDSKSIAVATHFVLLPVYGAVAAQMPFDMPLGVL